jgi:ubiquinone/menaquinone biosynthesis C-methylase UbiE
VLIEPATERLLRPGPGDAILDVACGAGRFARRMAELGACVTAFDHSSKFIERAKARTPRGAAIEFHVLDAAKPEELLSLGLARFDKAVCTMALMDMPEVHPLMGALRRMLRPSGIFVFSVTHPCFNSAGIQRFCEMYEEEAGRHVLRAGVKVSAYLQPFAKKTEGIIGQPEPQFYFHRPLHVLFDAGFREGFVVDGMEEPGFPQREETRPGGRWDDMPAIPPVMVVRMRLTAESQELAPGQGAGKMRG